MSDLANAPSPPSGPNRPPPPDLAAISAYQTTREQRVTFAPPNLVAQADEHQAPAVQTNEHQASAVQTGEQQPAPQAVLAQPLPPVQPATISMPFVQGATAAGGAAPARIALTAGDHTQKPEYDLGRRTSGAEPMMVVPVMAAEGNTAAPTFGAGVMLRPARQMDAGTARATLAGIVANAKNWMADFPHDAQGEGAATLNFFRGLISHNRIRSDAAAHGQQLDPHETETASFTPPPERHVLEQARQQVSDVLAAFESAMKAASVMLPPNDQQAVANLRKLLDL